MSDYQEKMTKRYVYDVQRYLPSKMREDVGMEIESLIDEMLRQRVGGKQPESKDVDIVLMELGAPSKLAARYQEKDRYLIGPELYPLFLRVLKIVLAATAGGMAAALVIADVISREPFTLLTLIQNTGSWFAAMLQAAAWCIVGFSIPGFLGKKGDMHWTPASLPEIPAKSKNNLRVDGMVGIVFLILAILLFSLLPQLMGFWALRDGQWIGGAVFDLDVLQRSLPLLLTAFALGLLRELFKVIEGRYTRRLAVATIILDVPALILSLLVFGQREIWNFNWLVLSEDLKEIQPFFEKFFLVFSAVILFAFLLDMGTNLIRGWKVTQ